jgi:hypothetical protein
MTHDFNSAEDILENFRLTFRFDRFIAYEAAEPVQAADWFKEEIYFSLANRGEDDKEFFTSEFIIVPFLKEIWKRHPGLNLFSHVQIKADDLIAIPDYLLSSKSKTGYKVVKKPLLLTVEAKNEKFEEGWRQALLQSVICRKINNTDKIPILSIVTTGDVWQFGKLEEISFIRHPLSVSVQNIEQLLGVLDVLFSECEKNILGN